jgi:type VI secretion system secreted protein VgrG
VPPSYHQANRPMTVTTPLGTDVLLLLGFSGNEAISQLFSFELDLAAEDQTKVIFDKVLGRKVTINLTLPGGEKRYFNGICTSLAQGMRGIDHATFQMEVAPHLWLLTLRSRSRIFQHLSVPEILKSVLDIPDVVFELEGTFHPRTYCVQYRETDFQFASRLMEEEGIYYYFKHKADSHQMVVSNKAAFPELQPAELILQQAEGTHVQEERITRWQKRQQLRPVKVTLRDYHFQMPQKSLEGSQEVQDDVKVGKVMHKLKIGEAGDLEIYDWPGEYAHRFDAISRAGADQPAELRTLLQDNERTAKIRMEQEAVEAIAIQGVGRYRHIVPGHTFTLKEQVVVPYEGSSSHDGKYTLTSVNHTGRMSGSYRSGDVQELHYDNSFTCIPAALHYRPGRITPKPIVAGSQTAVVVGPKGEQIFTDKYGRVKVQFHWDRDGKRDANSSCWIRVTQPWADKGFGMISVPRVGQEVVVTFNEGDPDRPHIVGTAYNADNPPPFKLPEHRMFSAFKTNSVLGNPAQNFSGLAFDDTPQKEHVALYAEKDLMVNAEHNHTHNVGNYQYSRIGSTSLTKIGSLPGAGGAGGGGSGGGGNGASGTTLEGDQVQSGLITSIGQTDRWTISPTSLPTFGFGGTTIYGINSQDTCGFMHQITIPQATQIVIDPVNAWGYVTKALSGADSPPWSGPVLPVGGNQQLYWGTNYQSIYGPNLSYTYASQATLIGPPSGLTKAMALIVPLLCLAYEITYAFIGGDKKDTSAIVAGSFSVALITANAILLESQLADYVKYQGTAVLALGQANLGMVTNATAAGATTVVKALGDLTAKTVLSFNQPELAKTIPLSVSDPVHNITFVNGDWLEYAHNCHLFAWQPPSVPDPSNPGPPPTSTIYINAYGNAGKDGYVLINASQQMALTSGAAFVGLVNTASTGGDLIFQCGETGSIALRRMFPLDPPGAIQNILVEPNYIYIEAGLDGEIYLGSGPALLPASETGIILMGADGTITLSSGDAGTTPYCKITLGPTGALSVQSGYSKASGCSIGMDPEQGMTLTCGSNVITINSDGVTIDSINFVENTKVQSQRITQLEKTTASLATLVRTLAKH